MVSAYEILGQRPLRTTGKHTLHTHDGWTGDRYMTRGESVIWETISEAIAREFAAQEARLLPELSQTCACK